MRAAVLLLLLAPGLALALRGPAECPGGCIIATQVVPTRVCECVSDSAASGGRGNGYAAGRVDAPGAPGNRLGSASDKFCDSPFGTYASFQACYAAQEAFQPLGGRGIARESYPWLQDSMPTRGGPRQLLQTCASPPAVPTDDGIVRTNCPYADASLSKWEELFPSTTSATDVFIPAGTSVLLNGCATPSVSVRSIFIPAGSRLIVADQPLTLNVATTVTVNGTLMIGSPTCPVQSAMTVFIPGGNATYGIDVAPEGQYDVHAVMQGLTWTRVASTVPATTAAAASRTISLKEAVQWRAGDKIVLASTVWKDEMTNQNEVLTISSVAADGLSLTTAENITFNHYGVEYQAEVGLLSRRILFTSDATSTSTGLGPHTTLLGPNARISGAAYERWGARNQAGRYSVHFHLAGEAPGAYVRNCAFYRTNWRCMSIHGTHAMTAYGNVGFDIHGHCYYLEDGVEERNTLERNLAAYVHPIHAAGSGGGQQGSDRWQNATLFDPSDASASGFYSLNAYNNWTNNAASGGVSGFTFPRAPRAIKNFRGLLKPNGYPFDPSRRPLLAFKGNSAHSNGYFSSNGAAVYWGGFIMYKVDPADSQLKLFYNSGRGWVTSEPLCPDPQWPANDTANANQDCSVGAERKTRNAADTADDFIRLDDTTVALSNTGIIFWGHRVEVTNVRAFDVTRGVFILGDSWITQSHFQINTTNAVNGWAQWPWSRWNYVWETPAIRGFQVYDTFTSHLISNTVYQNYRHKVTNSGDAWWYASAFAMMSHSDQFKPEKTLISTKNITFINLDAGTCFATNCTAGTGNALFRNEKNPTGAAWGFSWVDQDGSIVRAVDPSKPAIPYLIGSSPNWWKLDDANCWWEAKFNSAWVCPKVQGQDAARLDIRVLAPDGVTNYTMPSFGGGGENREQIGYISHWGDATKQIIQTRSEGVTGVTGNTGWYSVYKPGGVAMAPKRLRMYVVNLPRTHKIYYSACWPAGTTFTLSRTFQWATCMTNNVTMRAVATREELVAAGDGYAYRTYTAADTSVCLELKVMDPGHPWKFADSFQRDGMYIEKTVRWFDHWYDITASGPEMSCAPDVAGNTTDVRSFFCLLPGDAEARVTEAITTTTVAECIDVQPPNTTCASIKCGWTYWPGCNHATIISGGLVSTPPPSPPPSGGGKTKGRRLL